MTTPGGFDAKVAISRVDRDKASGFTMLGSANDETESKILRAPWRNDYTRTRYCENDRNKKYELKAVIMSSRTAMNFAIIWAVCSLQTEEINGHQETNWYGSVKVRSTPVYLGSDNIKMETKMKVYKCAVGSLFTYGMVPQ